MSPESDNPLTLATTPRLADAGSVFAEQASRLIACLGNRHPVGLSPRLIYRTARFLYHLFLDASELALPRLENLGRAAGPWRCHNLTAAHWKVCDAVVLGESLTTELARDPEQQNACGRPDKPFSGSDDGGEGSLGFGGFGVVVTFRVPRCVRRGCVRDGAALPWNERLILRIEPAAPSCAARPSTIILDHDFIRMASIPKSTRNAEWHGRVMQTLAHEAAHVWQFRLWKPQGRIASVGGAPEEFSPHSARPWETYALACGHAAWLIEEGFTSLDEQAVGRIKATMSLPDSPWRTLWIDWMHPEFAKAYPFEARAAKRYHRFLKMIFPVFLAERATFDGSRTRESSVR